MIRVLHIFQRMGNGGVEAFVMNIYRAIDRDRIQFDFLYSENEEGYFDREIIKLGGRIFRVYPLKKNPIKTYFDIARIVKENDYDIVHRHTGSAFGYFDLRAARRGGAKFLILHSHNPQAGKPILHKFSNMFLRFKCNKLACSEAAGEFLFGSNDKFTVFNNAIDCKKYEFSENIRKLLRKELNIEDKFVIGHVGRFQRQKNHRKLLEIFQAVVNQNPNSVLICVGDGELIEESKDYAQELGISDKVIYLGVRDDVPYLLNCFDVFCLPSLYEGFSIVLIEAQVNGLQCVTSKNVVPNESNISGNVHFVELECEAKVWADKILNVSRERDRLALSRVKSSGFDLQTTVKNLEQYYEKLMEG